jgi:arginyl-tRNA--protein-N-Asp/Glu arginylyltransferase
MNQRTFFQLYTTPAHECSYLPNQSAKTVFIDPYFRKDSQLYGELSRHGFRRSGEHIYRPHCPNCSACIPVRIPVHHFQPRRSQRRVWQKNQDLTVIPHPNKFNQEHFELYCQYLATRHSGGGMDEPTPKNYQQFLISRWAKTVFYEFRLQQTLVALAVVDHFEDGLSAMYTFFTPELPARSLGVYAILWEITQAKRLHKKWLYLGYWIEECQKMKYKTEYQPLEYLLENKWQPINCVC